MPEVKICGITRIEDAIAAAACNVDALGFIFYRKSPRYITPEAARRIIDALPRTISSVGVFVNEDIRTITDTVEYCGLSMIQLHGDEPPDYAEMLLVARLIKAFSLSSDDDFNDVLHYPCRAVLIDARVPGQYGGTGEKADWMLAAALAGRRPLILSGGLSPDNVAASIMDVSPGAVDVASGIERSPGIKDIEKMKRFISAARTAGPPCNDGGRVIFTATQGETTP